MLVLSRTDSCRRPLEVHRQFAVKTGSFDPSCSDLEFFGFHTGAPVYLKKSQNNKCIPEDAVFVDIDEGDLPEYHDFTT